MSDGTAAVELELPADAAWRLVTDWQAQGRWMPLTRVDVVSGDGGLGTRLCARTGIGPLSVVDDMVIDVWDPPRCTEVQHRGRLVTGRGIFRVEALPDNRSRVTWIERPDARSLTGRLGPFAALPTRLMLAVALRRLRRVAAELS